MYVEFSSNYSQDDQFVYSLFYHKVISLRGVMYSSLYHAIENKANQNTGKPLYIRLH